MQTVGAHYEKDNTCRFTVWAPEKQRMVLHLVGPPEQKHEMAKDSRGYFSLALHDIKPGAGYFYMPDGEQDYPDPASSYQPDGVHGASVVVDHGSYQWQDEQWRNIPQKELILYELHVGTFTNEGSFEAIIPRLDALKELGIKAIELMPVAQFPGRRNWGYDGVYPYAVQHSYGGPEGLKKLVDACHQKGIAVFLDVVYNHLGPEGNYLSKFGPYFTDKYSTPWGDAINYDGDWSDGVKEYFIGNILYWFREYHIDGLRLDAIHTMFDHEANSFWDITYQRIIELEQRAGRSFYLIAESDYNSPKVVRSPETGGFGCDAQWLDDFHHALYVVLHKEGKERYEDFGSMEQLSKAYTDGFVHSGEYVKFRKRKHGTSSVGVSGEKFVVFNQNHDQVGNRVGGERLCMLVDFERQKLAAAAILTAPYLPMLFMGEEYADETPFFYFVDHSDKELIKAVREGRQKEFAAFNKDEAPPDPQDEQTFRRSIINWESRDKERHRLMLQWHRHLIELRRTHKVLQNFNKNDIRATVLEEKGLVLHRQTEGGLEHVLRLFNFSEETLEFTLPTFASAWEKLSDSKDVKWSLKEEDAKPLPDVLEIGQKVSLPALSFALFASLSS